MTETLVRDRQREGVWHMFVDGFEVGELWAEKREDGSIFYGYSYQDCVSITLYTWLSEAEHDLVQLFKADLLSNQFSGALPS